MEHPEDDRAFRRIKAESVRITMTTGLPREEGAVDLRIGKSTLDKWLSQYLPTDLVSAAQANLARENERLREESLILKE